MNQIFNHLSIVSPVYQAEKIIDELVDRIVAQASLISDQFEILLIEDGSQDQSWDKIINRCRQDSRVKGIQLSRNFGQHAAIAAGIEASTGVWVIVMDCDLQDRPEEIAGLYKKAQEGYDIVRVRRDQKKQDFLSHFYSRTFYRVLSFLSGVQYDSSIANFGIYHRKVIHPILQIRSSIQYFPAIIHWIGFKQTTLIAEHGIRAYGKSSYTFTKKYKLALNALVTFSDKLLRLVVGFGAILTVFALAFTILMYARKGSEYAALIAIISFFSGLILFVLGTVGLYVGKMFDSHHVRPPYLIRARAYDSSSI